MALPITGPFTRTFNRPTPGIPTCSDYYYTQSKWKQAKPRDRPLGYQLRIGWCLARNVDNTSASTVFVYGDVDPQAGLIAYERFKSSISDRAEGAIFIAEREQALKMMTERCQSLYQFVRHLKRGNIAEAGKALKVAPPKGVSVQKHWASNYLEFHFGWAPMIADIGSAIDVLQSPIKNTRARGSGKVVPPEVHVPPPANFNSGYRALYSRSVRYGADVKVNNPNLWLANQLGFINPLTVAWELVPFSFVVDWFLPVGAFLSQGTDTLGLTLINPYTTAKQEAVVNTYWKGYPYTSTVRYLAMNRSLSILQPAFAPRPAKMWGWRRAAAALSLLIQQFGR